MKIFLLCLCVLGLSLLAIIHTFAIPKAENDVQEYLSKYGFKNTSLKETKFDFDGLRVQKIQLGDGGFSKLQNVKAYIFWPTYIFRPKIKSIYIENIQISSTTDEILKSMRLMQRNILKLKSENNIKTITAPNIIWDISTQYGPIRFNGDLKYINQTTQKLLLNLSAAQHQLAFNSKWQIEETEDNKIYAEAEFSELKTNMPPISLNRGNGWISFSSDAGLSGQMDAGSGTLIGLPLQSINVITNSKDDYYSLIIRSGVSGNKETDLSADIKFSNNIESQNFNFRLSSTDFPSLLEYLLQQEIIDSPVKEKNSSEKLLFIASYLQDKRFADGPWPFEITASNDDKNSTNGVFLLYPKTQEIRGTAQGDENIISFFKTLLNQENNDNQENIIRLDENLKNYIFQ